MKTYIGARVPGGPIVAVEENGNREILSAIPSRKLINHSPTGFEWGYGGSGPAQLALALLLDATGDEEIARRYYQDFKWQVVARWGRYNGFQITQDEIRRWLREQGAEL